MKSPPNINVEVKEAASLLLNRSDLSRGFKSLKNVLVKQGVILPQYETVQTCGKECVHSGELKWG